MNDAAEASDDPIAPGVRALAVGFFDGVHRAHQAVLAEADAALTFLNHPTTVCAPARAPRLLMETPARLAAIAAALRPAPGAPAADRVRALAFTPAFAAWAPARFVAWLRRVYPDLETVLCGPNWTFGAGGAGTAEFLRARGLAVRVWPFVEAAGAPVSSTRIRAALAAGDCAAASDMLGRAWEVALAPQPGKGLARALGFPTINLPWPAALVRPPRGVYAVGTPWGRGVANLGRAPTLGADAWRADVLEVHVLGSVPAALPPAVRVAFLGFLRPERAFASLDDLRAQIARDVATII